MDTNSNIDISNVFDEIKPYLIFKAKSFGAPNPSDFVQEWLTKAYLIANRFDTGVTQRQAFDEEQKLSVSFDDSKHSEKDFLKSFKGYLKKSFLNDLIKYYRSQEKKTEFLASEKIWKADAISSIDALDNLIEAVYLKSIIDLLNEDYSKIEKPIRSSAEAVNELFFLATIKHCEEIQANYGNIVVAAHTDKLNNSNFFTKDFREMLDSGIRKQLCKILLEHDNPIIIEKISILIRDEGKASLQKRICRYFYSYLGGYPKRIRSRMTKNERQKNIN